MRSSVFVAATLAGVASAWPRWQGTVGTAGTGGIFPTGTGIPHGPGPVSIPSGVFPPSILPTGTGRPHGPEPVSIPSGVFPPSGSHTGFPTYTSKPISSGGVSPGGPVNGISGGATGTGIGGSGPGHSTLPPLTITVTSDVPTTTTKTVEYTNTITTTVGKFDQRSLSLNGSMLIFFLSYLCSLFQRHFSLGNPYLLLDFLDYLVGNLDYHPNLYKL